jgi:hypothetical protein
MKPIEQWVRIPCINWCLLDFLVFIDTLFDLADETAIHPQIGKLLVEIKKRASASRT